MTKLTIANACAYDVIVGEITYFCQTFKEASELAKQFDDAKIILPNGEEYVEEVKKELSEVDLLCLYLFGTLHPKKKDYRYTLKQLLSETDYKFAAYIVLHYGTTSRVSPKAQVKLASMSGRQVIKLVVEVKKIMVAHGITDRFIIQNEIADGLIIQNLILTIRK
jgi:hypothetical protein